MSRIVAVYPGSFDPITLGHLDIIERSSQLFPTVVVAVSEATRSKRFAFDTGERVSMIRKVVGRFGNVRITPFSGLLTHFARSIGARVVIRGLRAISDFEYEFQMASMNHTLAPEVETVFMMTATQHSYLSSSIVKEIAALHGDIAHLVPGEVHADIVLRFSGTDPAGSDAPVRRHPRGTARHRPRRGGSHPPTGS
jgi:pantetheine-phosphate adenylyltransferase